MDDKTIEKAIMATLDERAAGKTACPSEMPSEQLQTYAIDLPVIS